MSQIIARFSGPLDDFDLDSEFTIPAKGVTALFGQSGCGKTSVLRCLAGLNRQPGGFLSVKGQVWQDETSFLPTHQRPVGVVFQEASLFPHLSVKDNLVFGQKRAGERGELLRLDDIVALLGVGDLLGRSPLTLSGGERQRVAIGRALLCGPELMLMDEPLAALDRFSKDEIIPYLETLFRKLDIPMIFVSHDTDEVERLADWMVLMEKGRVLSSGPLGDVLSDPELFIARGAKTASVVEGRVTGFDPEDLLSEMSVTGGKILVPGKLGEIGTLQRIRISANDVSLAREKPSRTTILNVLPVRILTIHSLDEARVNVLLSAGHGGSAADNGEPRVRFIARITRRSLRNFAFEVGQDIYAQVKSVSMLNRQGRRADS
ncbi:molybdenum ABC transporter ATP-binding protein [Kiloniella laminariae]|uniref:molybdenum ABC transporter ATP-binding protein n=1 Tax=Kiloniella laminariae TaxID=454162 RepID=UPI000373D7A7|nr:molybdenum ABC transporter ATP-binding protein [Kiloniella laminariae]